MLANPRTRTSCFHRVKDGASVANFRISCLHHPNVLSDREIVPGAAMRRYVEQMLDDGQTQHAEQEPSTIPIATPSNCPGGRA